MCLLAKFVPRLRPQDLKHDSRGWTLPEQERSLVTLLSMMGPVRISDDHPFHQNTFDVWYRP